MILSYVAPNPTQIGTDLVQNVGGQTLDFAIGVAPVAVPIVLGLTAVTWALAKFGLLGKRKARA
jgi:hypothetical protein